MELILYIVISFVVGFLISYGFFYWHITSKEKPKMNYNLPSADEYKPYSNPRYEELKSVDGSNAKDDFTIAK